ncbi:hypothetical protein F0562_015890 [Nyssa sinensis]|uniref:CCHC-type domain-containing protein n=1 Tax=Nyssa sinensis TaxID=561372 RepID=A0A5J4ZLA2_9ASTE|nr:hypothetical protein F0562_015890 [Nyssa sinensis]
MTASGDPKLQQLVILSDDSEDEGLKNDRSCKIDGAESSNRGKNEGNADQKENYVYRTLAQEYKMIADLTDYPNLAAMFAFEAKWKENRKKKNKKKKKKKKIELEPQNETHYQNPEKMEASGDPKLQQVVILSDDNDDESQKNDQSCKIDGKESSNREKNEGNAHQKETYVYRSRAEEYKMIADLTGYPNLAAMYALEAKLRENRKKKNKKRKKKNQKIDLEAQNEMVNEVGKEEERARNDVPQMLFADAAEEENQVNTSKAVETTITFRADDDVRPVTVIDLGPSSSERDKAIVDLRSPKSPGEMVLSGEIVRKGGKRIVAEEDNVYEVKEGEKPNTAEAVKTTETLETQSVPETEDIMPIEISEHVVYEVKEGEKPDTAEAVKTTEASETQPVPETEDIMPIEISVYAWKEGKQPETDEAVETTKELETESVPGTGSILPEKLFKPETVEAVETTKELETESVPETESILPEKLFVKVAEEKKQADSSKDAEPRISLETESVERAGNTVLQKLLRGPRYFDLPKNGWGMCFNCGEDDHTAVNCIVQKRKKPCFVCGRLEHNAKHCKQRKHCVICRGSGHLAKDCIEKHPTNNGNSKICLRCGDSGHNMFSCTNDYFPDDLKKIQCYVCKAFGHLCCADFIDEDPRQVSCYNCGQSGHLGSGCTKPRGIASGSQSTILCYKCGEQGHFARECIKHYKVGQGTSDFATPERFPEKKKDILGFKSTPHDFHKARRSKRKRRKTMNSD